MNIYQFQDAFYPSTSIVVKLSDYSFEIIPIYENPEQILGCPGLWFSRVWMIMVCLTLMLLVTYLANKK